MRLALLPTRSGDPPLRFAFRLAWLVVLAVAVVSQASDRVYALPLVVLAGVGWVLWATARRPERAAAAIVLLAAAGAVTAVWAPLALGFVAMAGIAAGTTLELRRAAPLALSGLLVVAAASAAHGWSSALVGGAAAGALAGLVGGIARRQARDRDALAARMHLAREIHDVLAHTLAALAVQLEAAEAVLEHGDEAKLREVLQRSRGLVASGLDETAHAVRALRDEPVEIADRVAELVAGEPVALSIEGTPRPLRADAGLALYRAAQEALTNARKHAPGAATSVSLAFGDDDTVLRVTNAPAALPAAPVPGAGAGLQGMRERLELAGGRLAADATPDGWVVEASVPA